MNIIGILTNKWAAPTILIFIFGCLTYIISIINKGFKDLVDRYKQLKLIAREKREEILIEYLGEAITKQDEINKRDYIKACRKLNENIEKIIEDEINFRSKLDKIKNKKILYKYYLTILAVLILISGFLENSNIYILILVLCLGLLLFSLILYIYLKDLPDIESDIDKYDNNPDYIKREGKDGL